MLNRLHFLKFYPLSNEYCKGLNKTCQKYFIEPSDDARDSTNFELALFLYIKDTITGLKLINKSKLLMSP